MFCVLSGLLNNSSAGIPVSGGHQVSPKVLVITSIVAQTANIIIMIDAKLTNVLFSSKKATSVSPSFLASSP